MCFLELSFFPLSFHCQHEKKIKSNNLIKMLWNENILHDFIYLKKHSRCWSISRTMSNSRSDAIQSDMGWQGWCHLKDGLRKTYMDHVQWTRQEQLLSSPIFNYTRQYHHTADLAQTVSSQICASKKVALCTFSKCEALKDMKQEYKNNARDLLAFWERSGHEKTGEITLLRY